MSAAQGDRVIMFSLPAEQYAELSRLAAQMDYRDADSLARHIILTSLPAIARAVERRALVNGGEE